MENSRELNVGKNTNNLFTRVRSWFTGLSPLLKRVVTGVVVLIVGSLFILGNIYLFRFAKYQASKNPKGQPTPTVTPTPYPINRHGKLNFTVASGKKTGPQFMKGFVDPYDVKENNPQRISFNLNHSIPITSVKAIWHTDAKVATISLTLAEGTPTDGRWEGAWVADDTYLYNLSICAIASDGTEENKIDLTLR